MKKHLLTAIFFLISTNIASKSTNTVDLFFQTKWKLSKNQKDKLFEGEVLVDADVTNSKSSQHFKLKAAAYHHVRCRKALRKLSQLENYKSWISFVKSSTYSENSRLMTLTADHALLPYPMIIHIILDRPTKEGLYPFTFPTGMFSGLEGSFEVKSIDKRCMLFAKSTWSGPSTKLPNFAIELFSETLSRIGGEILLRKTK